MKFLRTLCILASPFLYAEKGPIQGIILMGESPSFKNMETVKGVEVRGMSVPGGYRAIASALKPFLGQEVSKDNLLAIKRKVIEHYQNFHRPIIVVELPDQDVTGGVVTYVITEGKIGSLEFKGNKWFSDKSLRRFVHLKPGDVIDEEVLLNDVAWMNQNPYHYTQVVLAPGEKKGKTNLEFMTEDRFPLRFYTGADNTGNSFDGNTRLYAGATFGNMWGIGDLLTYQYTSSTDFHQFTSHFGNYTSFFPWRHKAVIYGGYARIHPDFQGFRSEGKNVQASLRYYIPFRPLYKTFFHEFVWGFDYKNINSNLFFTGDIDDVLLTTNDVNITQLYFGYDLDARLTKHQLSFIAELFYSPGKWLPHQTNQDYEALKPHTTHSYVYGRLTLGDVYQLPKKFALSFLVRLQGTTAPLLPSEQFGLGGYNTVRGYDERIFNADQALCANMELRAPPFKVFRRIKDEMTFLAFIDYALGHNWHPLSGFKSTDQLISIGPGVRYAITPYLTARADYGFKLHRDHIIGEHLGKLNVGISVGY
jgi:hemolysin activation/secretion protein